MRGLGVAVVGGVVAHGDVQQLHAGTLHTQDTIGVFRIIMQSYYYMTINNQ